MAVSARGAVAEVPGQLQDHRQETRFPRSVRVCVLGEDEKKGCVESNQGDCLSLSSSPSHPCASIARLLAGVSLLPSHTVASVVVRGRALRPRPTQNQGPPPPPPPRRPRPAQPMAAPLSPLPPPAPRTKRILGRRGWRRRRGGRRAPPRFAGPIAQAGRVSKARPTARQTGRLPCNHSYECMHLEQRPHGSRGKERAGARHPLQHHPRQPAQGHLPPRR